MNLCRIVLTVMTKKRKQRNNFTSCQIGVLAKMAHTVKPKKAYPFDKLQNQDAKRSQMARAIDKGIRSPLDLTDESWAKKSKGYDCPGIDDPKSPTPKV
jgi:hypothetical protein